MPYRIYPTIVTTLTNISQTTFNLTLRNVTRDQHITGAHQLVPSLAMVKSGVGHVRSRLNLVKCVLTQQAGCCTTGTIGRAAWEEPEAESRSGFLLVSVASAWPPAAPLLQRRRLADRRGGRRAGERPRAAERARGAAGHGGELTGGRGGGRRAWPPGPPGPARPAWPPWRWP
jgi:hypothetical protein